MSIEKIISDKTIKAKAKVAMIGDWLLYKELPLDELIAFTRQQKKTEKATCIEAFEYATKKDQAIANKSLLLLVTASLTDDEPRIKWECAKVIGNIAKNFPDDLSIPIDSLLVNARYNGTVVRWASAYALAEIAKLKLSYNTTLLTQIELLENEEEDSGVKKKYIEVLKKLKGKA